VKPTRAKRHKSGALIPRRLSRKDTGERHVVAHFGFLARRGNRALLGWIGGGIAAVRGALWTAFVYFHPAAGEKPSPPQKQIEAECGSVAIGGRR
jgi:hypothetical protein